MIFQLVTVKKLMRRDGSAIDEEVEQISASYTTGGMTVSLAQTEATGADHAARYSRKMETWSFICVLI